MIFETKIYWPNETKFDINCKIYLRSSEAESLPAKLSEAVTSRDYVESPKLMAWS